MTRRTNFSRTQNYSTLHDWSRRWGLAVVKEPCGACHRAVGRQLVHIAPLTCHIFSGEKLIQSENFQQLVLLQRIRLFVGFRPLAQVPWKTWSVIQCVHCDLGNECCKPFCIFSYRQEGNHQYHQGCKKHSSSWWQVLAVCKWWLTIYLLISKTKRGIVYTVTGCNESNDSSRNTGTNFSLAFAFSIAPFFNLHVN